MFHDPSLPACDRADRHGDPGRAVAVSDDSIG